MGCLGYYFILELERWGICHPDCAKDSAGGIYEGGVVKMSSKSRNDIFIRCWERVFMGVDKPKRCCLQAQETKYVGWHKLFLEISDCEV